VGTVSSSDELGVLGIDGDWYLIILPDGKTGYISASLLDIPKDVEIATAPTITPTFTPTATATSTDTPTPTATPPFGTIDNPYPVGTTAVFDDFDIIVVKAIRRGTRTVQGFNMFNDDPPAGTDYVLVWFKLTCKKTGSDLCRGDDFKVRLIDENGTEWSESDDLFLVIDNDLSVQEAIGGRSIEGWQVFVFPEDQTVKAIWLNDGGILGGGDTFYNVFPTR